ncbi:MAG: GntR family transcriptional regulator [Bacteroidales bacterium]|nr:GntR family transcriptional regulator [Bacteroidales bacterium]
MDFHNDKPIYLQIADALCESILSGTLKAGDRIPSVREYGGQIGVNPNTVMRTYEKLTDEGIIYNKRGIGYFAADDAREKILEAQKADFLAKEVPAIRRKMELLGLDASIFKN